MTYPPLVVDDPTLADRHLLALPEGVEPDEIEVLAASRFRGVRWEDAPETQTRTGVLPAVTAAFGIRSVGRQAPRPARVLRLARLSTIAGPYAVDTQDAIALGLPASTVMVWVLDAPRERGERPWPGGDRDGLKRAFPDGLPVREEERVLTWLVAAARRLGGAVRTQTGAILTPDPDAATDLTVLTDRWIEPEEVLAIVQAVQPRAYLSVATPGSWTGPTGLAGRTSQGAVGGAPESGGSGLRTALELHGVQDPDERRRLMAEADAYDRLMLAEPPPAEAFGVLVDLGVDGMLAAEVAACEQLPPLMDDLPWTKAGVVAYRVRWEPFEIEQIELEKPSFEHRVARSRSAPLIAQVAKALHAVVGGEVADEADFLVDPADL
ncbi:conserved hypothetical protein [Cellulomonas flavigena DSM 20109]|uniref:Uncharacterized protein n=1 Tax=Cellulomonas flavigena (strain ATCC 482 / DSM 20109 / BCRC 11376 / JCM 18109 / NBRC 3775 / NCIMB 8073 / NRS 134) TaxID=446466 RepID=D5UG82_CELFN|nr:hypothetical protein [Cellulomonas flavigena]ADG73065.1 conserved hypothetical protein [Cellulomonas flavigena DSM 20109]